MTQALDTGQTILPALMTEAEAREKVARIRRSAGELRALLVEFDERQGWQALGYESMAACCESEFGWKKSHFYRQLQAAETEKALGLPIGDTPESHLRPLAGKPPDVQREAFREATANGPATAAKVEEAVRRRETMREAALVSRADPSPEMVSGSVVLTDPQGSASVTIDAPMPVSEASELVNRRAPATPATEAGPKKITPSGITGADMARVEFAPAPASETDDGWTVGEIDRAFFAKRDMSLADVLRVARRVVETSEDEEAGNNRRMAARAYLKKGA